jgi:hypothetical protein
MSLLTDAIAHADNIITAAQAEIDALTDTNGFVEDRPGLNVVDRVKQAIDTAAAQEDFSDLTS